MQKKQQKTTKHHALNDQLHYAIAITGGIASGKSTASNFFKERGHAVVCADVISHNILEDKTKEILREFGEEILDKQTNVINRKVLGKIVFNNNNARKRLESIMHPAICNKILSLASELESSKKWYFLDIPLFFECGGRERYCVKYVLSIIADQQTQLMRIKMRDNLSDEEALARINAQMDMAQKAKKSDFVIFNSDSKEAFLEKLINFLVNLNGL